MPETVQLAELMCARLCHDLGGAIGTLTGTLELARRATAEDTRRAATLAEATLAEATLAAEALAHRLRGLRAAWGSGGARLDEARLRELASGLPGQERVRLDLDLLPPGTQFGPGLGRVLLNLLILAPEALPRGGVLALSRVEEDTVLARLAGPRAAWPAGFAGYLNNPTAARAALATPRALLGPWLALLAPRLGVRLSLLLPTGNGRGNGPAPLLLRADTIA